MNNLFNAFASFFTSILAKAIIAFAICCVFALIHMAIFGEDAELPAIASIILLIGSIAVSHVIVNKFSKRKK